MNSAHHKASLWVFVPLLIFVLGACSDLTKSKSDLNSPAESVSQDGARVGSERAQAEYVLDPSFDGKTTYEQEVKLAVEGLGKRGGGLGLTAMNSLSSFTVRTSGCRTGTTKTITCQTTCPKMVALFRGDSTHLGPRGRSTDS